MPTKDFRVKVEDVSKIFEQLKAPSEILNSFGRKTPIPYILGKAGLSPPLREIRVAAVSSGKEFLLKVIIEIGRYFDKKKKENREYPVNLPKALKEIFFTSSVEGGAIYIYPTKESDEPRFIAQRNYGHILISAGVSGGESAPPIKLVSVQSLENRLDFLAKIIQTTIKGIYPEYSDACGVKIPEPDVVLYIRGPVIGGSEENVKVEADEGDKYSQLVKKIINKFDPSQIKETLDDVQGVEEAKTEVKELVDILKNPEKYKKMGAQTPRGALLMGEPGTGKTMLAKAIAKYANVSFFSVSGSALVEIWVGLGAKKIRDLFLTARKNRPCIIFFDEIDAVAGHRRGEGGGDSEYEQTLSQLLIELDGFEQNEGILVLGATNRPELLDEGIMRPGRLDRHITLDLPDVDGRKAILEAHSANKPLADDVDLEKIALSTPGFSGADLASLMNESALLAVSGEQDKICMDNITLARERVRAGIPRKTRMTDGEKIGVAYHEAGHAIVQTLLYPDSDPVEFVTITPRGDTLGVVVSLPEEELRLRYKNRLEAQLAIFAAGRVAEEIHFGKDNYSIGAQSDIHRATDFTINMIAKWGMGEIGFINLSKDNRFRYLNLGGGFEDLDEDTKNKIYKEAAKKLNKAYKKAKKILEKHKPELRGLAEMLVKKETLSGEEVRRYLNKPLPTEK